jgi:DNA topoisomerase III
MVELAEPHAIDPAWKAWRWDRLPMLPKQWPLIVSEKTKDQFAIVERAINDRKTELVINACDAGREGELIFRYVYEAAGCKKRIARLWISTLTPAAIQAGFKKLASGKDYEPLAAAARGRAKADWLVGLNLSRTYTLLAGETLSVGRVQTPTLALVVERELAIRRFVPEAYFEVEATFETKAGTYAGTWTDPRGQGSLEERQRFSDRAKAEAIVARARSQGPGVIVRLDEQQKKMPAPQLYDLAELQRHANRVYGFSAKRTLDTAQALYESKKLLSYPRTDSRHLSKEASLALPEIVKMLAPLYKSRVAPGSDTRALGKRFVDDAEIGDHHAIIPTGVDPRSVNLSDDERKIYDLVARRLLMAWHPDWITATTTIVTEIGADPFQTSGTRTVQEGWKVLDPPLKGMKPPPLLPVGLERDLAVGVEKVEVLEKTTRPPKRLTEATLLTAMETAGRTLDDRALSKAMQDRGLGTPATRASMIETLLHRELIARDGKSLLATERGIALIARVDPRVASPAMTGEWESKLRAIERGELALPKFMEAVEHYVAQVVEGGRRSPSAPRQGKGPRASAG